MPVYLVRLMSLGEELERVETTSIREARTAYKGWWPPERWSASPSLRVDGKRLSWEREMRLMKIWQGDGPEPEEPKRAPPFARVSVSGRDVTIRFNRTAEEFFYGVRQVCVEVDPETRTIRVVKAPDGLSLYRRKSKGCGVCANAALKGLAVRTDRRFPVRQIMGGAEFCWE